MNLKLCGEKLKLSNYLRYLGIHLDKYLNHFSEKLVKANAMLQC